MAARFLIGEKGGTEFGVSTEYLAKFYDIFQNESLVYRLDQLINSHPFLVPANEERDIVENHQLVNVDGFIINGQLNLSGSLVI